jgi:tetratricopeptide (TPR) repeat protein
MARRIGNKTWKQDTAQASEQVGDLQFAQAKAFDQTGNALESTQQVTAALASYQKSLVIREHVLHATPEDVDAQLNAAHAFNQIGNAFYWSRHPAEAANAIRAAARMFQNIVDAHHDTPQIRVKLLRDLYSLSQMSDNKTEAGDDLRKSLAIAIELDREHAAPDEMIGVVTFLQDALSKLTKQPTPSKPH